jgi:type I restriction enzyme, S subunit
LKPYPEYKDSGLPWLGNVPEHWLKHRIKKLFREKDERSGDGRGVLLSMTRAHGIVPQAEASNRIASAEDLSKYKVCRRGDLVMNRMQAWSGMFAVSSQEGLVSPDYSVFGPIGACDVKYFEHLFKTPVLVDQFAQRSKGIGSGFNRLYTPDFGSIPVIVPLLLEQAAIVRYLYHFDRHIRSYIRAKQKLIKLLEEQKQVIIHRAVTRGIDPNVRLKPSGLGWLGDIPEHWSIVQVRRLISFITSGSRGWASFYSDSGNIFLQSGNLGRSMSLNLSFIQYVQPPQGSEGERTRVRCDDLLVCITGALTGNVVHVNTDLASPAFVNQHVALVRPNRSQIYPRYLAFALHSEIGRIQFKIGEYGGTKQGLGLDDVKRTLIPLPTMQEQKAISSKLDATMDVFATAINNIEHEIYLLHEYHAGLISDIVTGKLDVRWIVLPEESDEAAEQENWSEGEVPETEEMIDTEEVADESD